MLPSVDIYKLWPRKNVSAEGLLVYMLVCLLPGGMSCGPSENESEGVFKLCRTLRCFTMSRCLHSDHPDKNAVPLECCGC